MMQQGQWVPFAGLNHEQMRKALLIRPQPGQYEDLHEYSYYVTVEGKIARRRQRKTTT